MIHGCTPETGRTLYVCIPGMSEGIIYFEVPGIVFNVYAEDGARCASDSTANKKTAAFDNLREG